MNCKKIQNLILTDYLDKQLDPAKKNFIDNHVSKCPYCKDFLNLAEKSLVEPFDNSSPENIPDNLWQNIRSEIEHEINKKYPYFLFRNFKNFIFFRPAFTFSSVFTILILIFFSLKFFPFQRTLNNEEIEYISSIMYYSSNDPEDFSGYGTDIEKIFLKT